MSFSKNVPTMGNESQMRDSDKRKFKARIAAQFPNIGSAQLEELIPKDFPLIVTKLENRQELISRGRDPLFFTNSVVPGEPGELVPTIYALRIAPQAFCRVVMVYPGLEKNVCRGADLFLPGVVRPDGGDLEKAAQAARKPWPEILFGGPVKKGELCCLVSQVWYSAPRSTSSDVALFADDMLHGPSLISFTGQPTTRVTRCDRRVLFKNSISFKVCVAVLSTSGAAVGPLRGRTVPPGHGRARDGGPARHRGGGAAPRARRALGGGLQVSAARRAARGPRGGPRRAARRHRRERRGPRRPGGGCRGEGRRGAPGGDPPTAAEVGQSPSADRRAQGQRGRRSGARRGPARQGVEVER